MHNPNTIPWLRSLADKGGKGGVTNVDARSLGRVADELQSTRAEIGELHKLIRTALTGEHGFCAVSRGWIYSKDQACTRCDAMETLEKIAKKSLQTKDKGQDQNNA